MTDIQMITITEMLGTHRVLDMGESGGWIWVECYDGWEFNVAWDGVAMWWHDSNKEFLYDGNRWTYAGINTNCVTAEYVTTYTGGK